MKKMLLPRVNKTKRDELEALWRAYIWGRPGSTLTQREYCEALGMPLKRFGSWRAKFKHEDPWLTCKLLGRCGGASEHMCSDEHRYISSARVEQEQWSPELRDGG